jgi:hypothetical protein
MVAVVTRTNKPWYSITGAVLSEVLAAATTERVTASEFRQIFWDSTNAIYVFIYRRGPST